jgi:hypothetical protein
LLIALSFTRKIFIKAAKGVNPVKEFLDYGKLGCFRTMEEFVYGYETV